MATKSRILIIDDEADIRTIIRDMLASQYEVFTAANGPEGLRLAAREMPDLIVLDILMPQMDGIEVCRTLKADAETRRIPVVMLTAAEDDEKRALALKMGADDLVSKPFRPKEFLVRMELKMKQLRERPPERAKLVCGNLSIDPLSLEARIDGKLVELSILEFNLLTYLVRHLGQILNRENILNAVWKNTEVSDRVVDNHISVLRKKLQGFDRDIVAVYGAGYGIKVREDR